MSNPNPEAPQVVVAPLTGFQIVRRVPLTHLNRDADEREAVWKAAQAAKAKPPVANPMLHLVEAHSACDQGIPGSGWIACDPAEAVFFRLCRIGTELVFDLAIDTQNGAGRMPHNWIKCEMQAGGMFSRKRRPLASVYVAAHDEPRAVAGSLVMDFGNTATAFIFHREGAPPLEARPITVHNPFDPHDGDESMRPRLAKAMLRSTAFLLRVPDDPDADPWLTLGERADELIAINDPLVTSLYAPKKYVRDWPEQLKPQEPTTGFHGLSGARIGLVPVLDFVAHILKQMLALSVSSQVNPRFASVRPDYYPRVRQVLLTYPLTWREQDKELFRRMTESAAGQSFFLDGGDVPKVELVCSEPVAVASYALWEVFFHFLTVGPRNLLRPSLAASLMGNVEGTQEARLLVIDIGGGSTDVALVEADWAMPEGEETVDARVRVLESMRYNRAGDRISHLLAAAVIEYFRVKYDVAESLDFDAPATNPGFTRTYKRGAVSKIAALAEAAKAHLAASPEEPWELSEQDENDLLQLFGPAATGTSGTASVEPLRIAHDVLRRWVEADRQSMKSRGEPGLMDVFLDLAELRDSLDRAGRPPHLALVSGRTTRLPFIRALIAKHLRLPPHRVRALGELMPAELHPPDYENIDKLAVVHGAHRFRFGYPVRFIPVPDEPTFKRFIGVVSQTPTGLKLNKTLVRPGEPRPRTCTLRVNPGATVLLGHSFREDGNRAEVIAALTNASQEWRDVQINLVDDHRAELARRQRAADVTLTERVPGGTDTIVDNFNDTGRIDQEPEGLLRQIVLSNQAEWLGPGY